MNSEISAPPIRILLVEDHAPTLAIVSLLLEREGFDVATADSMGEALSHAGAGTFDVMVSDLGLPDGSGFELLRTLRNRGAQFPAIAMSGYGQEEDQSATGEAGFCLHLVKPVDIPELKEAISTALQPPGAGG